MMIKVSIVGATGYTGGELLRLLLRHPHVSVVHVTSETSAGKPISSIHKFLKGQLDLLCEKVDLESIAKDSDVVFVGLPHGAAAQTGAALYKLGVKVIDLSADFRLEDLPTIKAWYGEHPAPDVLKKAVYGLPERYREKIRKAKLVANPGCYATTSILAGLPLMAKHLLGKGPIIVDAKSGITGAGRKLENMYLYSESNESIQAYALKGHRHQPEILQEWKAVGGTASELIFVPQLVPMQRGIFAVLYAPLKKKTNAEELQKLYAHYYAKEPFVTVLAPYESPEVKAVAYTNYCQIGVSVDPSGMYAIVIATLDNLVKGASGQAIQNMNLMCGLDETVGLR